MINDLTQIVLIKVKFKRLMSLNEERLLKEVKFFSDPR